MKSVPRKEADPTELVGAVITSHMVARLAQLDIGLATGTLLDTTRRRVFWKPISPSSVVLSAVVAHLPWAFASYTCQCAAVAAGNGVLILLFKSGRWEPFVAFLG